MGSCPHCSNQGVYSGYILLAESSPICFLFVTLCNSAYPVLLLTNYTLLMSVRVSWQLLKELGAPVEYIVLPTFAYEHKIFVGPFSREFPRAQVWVAPRQWSWPLNLPLEFFGIFRAKTLKDDDLSTPWAYEIEQKVLSSPEVGNTNCNSAI